VLVALGRQSLPHVLEATLVPAIISYVLLLTVSPGAAMIAVLAWTYFAVGRRLVRGREIPAILLLATVGLTVRTIIGVASGSTFAYFVQPVATTVARRFLRGFNDRTPVIARSRPTSASSHGTAAGFVVRLFGLSWQWRHIVTAAMTFGLSMQPGNYVRSKPSCLA
jgi:hypothetical protein